MARTLGPNAVLRRTLIQGVLIIGCVIVRGYGSQKYRYATLEECDRYSLHAVYHEKFQPITNNIFADTKEFGGRVTDLLADSFTTISASLPDRESSDVQDRKMHGQFKLVKSNFISQIKKIQRNITSSWDELLKAHFELMYDSGNSSLEDYLNKAIRMIDSYGEGRNSLDSLMSHFIAFIKSTLEDGLVGLEMAAEYALKKDEQGEKNEKEDEEKDKTEGVTKKSREELLIEKKEEIGRTILPGVLGKVTIEILKRKMDLNKKSDKKPEERESLLDDIQFDMLMVRNRMQAIIQTGVPRDKGATDVARRSIYIYWAEVADGMYQEKLRYKKSGNGDKGRLYYRNLWQDEEQLVDTLMTLMETYP